MLNKMPCSHQKVTALNEIVMLTDVITELKNSVTPHLFLNKKITRVVYCFHMHAYLVFVEERVANSEITSG